MTSHPFYPQRSFIAQFLIDCAAVCAAFLLVIVVIACIGVAFSVLALPVGVS